MKHIWMIFFNKGLKMARPILYKKRVDGKWTYFVNDMPYTDKYKARNAINKIYKAGADEETKQALAMRKIIEKNLNPKTEFYDPKSKTYKKIKPEDVASFEKSSSGENNPMKGMSQEGKKVFRLEHYQDPESPYYNKTYAGSSTARMDSLGVGGKLPKYETLITKLKRIEKEKTSEAKEKKNVLKEYFDLQEALDSDFSGAETPMSRVAKKRMAEIEALFPEELNQENFDIEEPEKEGWWGTRKAKIKAFKTKRSEILNKIESGEMGEIPKKYLMNGAKAGQMWANDLAKIEMENPEYPEGQVMIDANGNKAKMVNGKWVEVD